jgi:hypothetical protein
MSIDGAPYLVVGDTPIRCYPYPAAESEVAARMLILRNSVTELLKALELPEDQ